MAENERPVVIYHPREGRGGREGGRNLQTEKYKNNDCTYHIFDSSSISSNRGLAPRTSVIVLLSHFLFTGAISKQATKQLVPDLFLSALPALQKSFLLHNFLVT